LLSDATFMFSEGRDSDYVAVAGGCAVSLSKLAKHIQICASALQLYCFKIYSLVAKRLIQGKVYTVSLDISALVSIPLIRKRTL
jgi:hypothetical protein